MTTNAGADSSRRNGAISRGPRTKVGKARSAANSWRHGFSATGRPPVAAPEIRKLAEALVEKCNDRDLFEQALIFSECELRIARIHEKMIYAIERLLVQELRSHSSGVRGMEAGFKTILIRDGIRDEIAAYVSNGQGTRTEMGTIIPDGFIDRFCAWTSRTESEAVLEAGADLARLTRYERLAFARRRKAFMEFLRIRFELRNRAA